jgi:hypothetical protein
MSSDVKITLYIGKGASHSWIWLVDTFDKYGFTNIQFVTDITQVKADLFIISGGDPFAMFSHIKEKGVSLIQKFIEQGGTYIGICAGTYFALHYPGNPYPWLNLVKADVANFAQEPPPNIRMPHKYTVPHTNGYVFHPVREEVILDYRNKTVKAPLYGGPGIISTDGESLAVYKRFTKKTLFLCDRTAAEHTLLGTTALLTAPYGKGCIYLFGPHFEHPHYPEANTELITLLSHITPGGYPFQATGDLLTGDQKKAWTQELKRWISNGRLAAYGLGTYHWKIGEKVYDPERFAYFFETCFNLTKFFETQKTIYTLNDLPEKAKMLAVHMRRLGPDPADAELLLERIKTFTSCLYSLYFTLQQLQPRRKP